MVLRALKIRTVSSRPEKQTTNRRSLAERPMMISRWSSAEWSSSSKIRANESAKTVRASPNDTPCLETLAAAFFGSHSNFRSIPHQYGTTTAADPASPRNRDGRLTPSASAAARSAAGCMPLLARAILPRNLASIRLLGIRGIVHEAEEIIHARTAVILVLLSERIPLGSLVGEVSARAERVFDE